MLGATLLATLFLAQGLTAPNLLAVTGTAEKSFAAERATLFLNASATAASEEVARVNSEKTLDRAVAASRTLLADPSLYEARKSWVIPQLQNEAGGFGTGSAPSIKGYTAQSSIQVHGVKLDGVDTLIKAVARVEGASAGLVEYGIKDEAAARRAVIRAAFLDARAKAQEAADAAGLKLGGIYLLEVGNGATLSPLIESNGVFPGGPGYKSSPAKQVVARATVMVRFYIGQS